MKTSWNELRRIDDYFLNKLSAEDKLVFDAEVILQPGMAQDVRMQRKTYTLVHEYGRKQLRKEIEGVHDTLFNTKRYQSFRQKILNFFNK
ncbi:MAG TPA: hypothetical protein VKB19_03175 [Pedobacter sp.]|nr:hypothetical protein [Pedobacter sp.]